MLRIVQLLICATLVGCVNENRSNNENTIFPNPGIFQDTIDEKPVNLYTIRSQTGMQAAISNYGARVIGLFGYDAPNKVTRLTSGFDSICLYQADTTAMGSLCSDKSLSHTVWSVIVGSDSSLTLLCKDAIIDCTVTGNQFVVQSKQLNPVSLALDSKQGATHTSVPYLIVHKKKENDMLTCTYEYTPETE